MHVELGWRAGAARAPAPVPALPRSRRGQPARRRDSTEVASREASRRLPERGAGWARAPGATSEALSARLQLPPRFRGDNVHMGHGHWQ